LKKYEVDLFDDNNSKVFENVVYVARDSNSLLYDSIHIEGKRSYKDFVRHKLHLVERGHELQINEVQKTMIDVFNSEEFKQMSDLNIINIITGYVTYDEPSSLDMKKKKKKKRKQKNNCKQKSNKKLKI